MQDTEQSSIRTLEEVRDERAVVRARDWRRAGLAALLLTVVAALVGLLGVTSTTVTDRGSGATLAVTHARVVRAGIAVPLHVVVTRPGGFDAPVQLVASASLFERFDFQNLYPNPAKETADDHLVRWEFDPPPGDVLRINLDARTAPDQNGSWGRYDVALLDAGSRVASVSFRMVVVP